VVVARADGRSRERVDAAGRKQCGVLAGVVVGWSGTVRRAGGRGLARGTERVPTDRAIVGAEHGVLAGRALAVAAAGAVVRATPRILTGRTVTVSAHRRRRTVGGAVGRHLARVAAPVPAARLAVGRTADDPLLGLALAVTAWCAVTGVADPVAVGVFLQGVG